MTQFVDRQEALDELNALLESARRGKSDFVIISGRRRIGKTTLILNWSEQCGRSTLYWVARRETPEATRYSLPGPCGVRLTRNRQTAIDLEKVDNDLRVAL